MSRTIDILNAKKTGVEYTADAYSRSETILKSIANNTENLINVSSATIEGGALKRFEIPLESVKGKTISASAFVQNKSTEGSGARIRIDVTNNGTVTYAMGNDIATGRNGISKAENVSIPLTATKVEFSVQSYSGNVGNVVFSRFMVNLGATVKSYIEYINGTAQSRYETLLLAIKNGNNFLPFPYTHSTRTLNGITWTVDENKKVSVNGALSGSSSNYLFTNNIVLTDGKYKLPANYISGAWYVHGVKANGEVDYNIQDANNNFVASKKYAAYSIGYIISTTENVNFVITPILQYNEAPKTRLEEIITAAVNGTFDTWLAGKNIFNAKTFRQGGHAYESPSRLHSDMYTRFNREKTYTISTNLDMTKFEYGINGTATEGVGGTIVYDSNWQTEQTFILTANTTHAETKYLGIVIRKKDNDNITPAEIADVQFKIELGSTATEYTPYCFTSEIEEAFYNTFGAE